MPHAPLTDVHPHARLASTDLLDYATALGLDVPRFARDVGAGRYARRVQHDAESAEASGVSGTPTFFVGERRHTGPYDAGTLAADLLADAGEDAVPEPARAGGGDPTPPPPGHRGDEQPQDPSELLSTLPEDPPETPERGGDHPRLTDAQLARLERVGTRRRVARGDTLYRVGDPGYDFHVILSGVVAVIGYPGSGEQPVVRVHGERRFLGALDVLGNQRVVRTAVVVRDEEVLRLTTDQLGVLAEDPELRDLVLRAYLVRHAIGFELSADLRIVGRPGSPEVRRLREYADTHGLTSALVDLEGGDGDQFLTELGVSGTDLPVVVLRTGRVLRNPGDAELDRALRVPD